MTGPRPTPHHDPRRTVNRRNFPRRNFTRRNYTRRRRLGAALVSLAAIGLLTACATTVDDSSTSGATGRPVIDQSIPPGASLADGDPAPIEGGVITAEAAGDPDIGDPDIDDVARRLVNMATEMSRLGSQVADGGDATATLTAIEATWTAIRAEVELTNPELVYGIGSTVDMARVAVERTRPADADKAFSILTDLVDKYTGDG